MAKEIECNQTCFPEGVACINLPAELGAESVLELEAMMALILRRKKRLAGLDFKSSDTHLQEVNRRTYYQDIVYDICRLVDRLDGTSNATGVVCGTYGSPSRELQDRISELIDEVVRLRRESK